MRRPAFSYFFLLVFLGLGSIAPFAGADEVEVSRFALTDSTRPLQAGVNEACGNPPDSAVDFGFSCARGAAAVPALARGVSRINITAVAARNHFFREVPEAIRARLRADCAEAAGEGVAETFNCFSRVLEEARSESDSTWDPDRALEGLRQFQGQVLARSVWSLACRRAAGDVVVRGSGRSRRLVAARRPSPGEPSAACDIAPAYTPLDAVPFSPGASEALDPIASDASLLALYQPPASLLSSESSVRGCEGVIPHAYCGSGSSNDPLAVARGGSLPLTSELLDDLYTVLHGEHVRDWALHIAHMNIDRALELIYLQVPPGASRDALLSQWALATASCTLDGIPRYLGDSRRMLNSAGAPASEIWNQGMARAAQCLSANVDRWSQLREELGFDIEMVRTLIRPEEIDRLPPGVRHLARGVTGLPGLRHFLLEMPHLTGLNESATRTCGFLQERVDGETVVSGVAGVEIPRAAYCRAAYNEFLLLSYEIDSLYSSFPTLAHREAGSSGEALYVSLTSALGGVGAARPPSRSDPEGCFDHVYRSGNVALTPSEHEEVSRLAAGRISSTMEPLLATVRAACDSDLREDLVAEALQHPSLVDSFFRCRRDRFPILRSLSDRSTGTAGDSSTDASWVEELSSESCGARLDSSWLSCRLYDENQASGRRNEVIAQAFTVGMDLLTLATPVTGFATGVHARTVLTAAGIGAGLGFAIAPSPEEAGISSETDAALFLSGAGSIANYERALRSLEALAAQDPRWESAITGAVMGGLLAGLAGEPPAPSSSARWASRLRDGDRIARLMEADPALWSSQMDLEMVAAYRVLERSGGFVDDIGRAAQEDLEALFIARLHEKYPDVPLSTWTRMRNSDRLLILEGRLEPPNARGPPGVRAEVPEAPSASRPAPTRATPDTARSGPVESPSGTGSTRARLEAADDLVRATVERRTSARPTVFTEGQEIFVTTNRSVPETLRLATPEQNRSFIALAEGASRGRGDGLRFFEVENSVLKALNDRVFGSKEVVNAVENRWRSILLEEIRRDEVLSGALRGEYQDFKSLRFAFDPAEDLSSRFNEVFTRANRLFSEEIRTGPFANALEDSGSRLGDPSRWHMAAEGNTVDEAGAAARYARALDTPGGVPVQSIEGAQGWLLNQFQDAELRRARWVASLSEEAAARLLRRSSGPLSERVPSESVFELVRKVNWENLDEGIRDLQGRIQRRFGVLLSEEQVRMLRDYASSVDSFSVGLLIPERVSNDLSPAGHGMVSADFAGQGGRNLAETAEALARSRSAGGRSDITTVIREAREAEVRATDSMRRLNDDFRVALERTVGRDSVRRLTFSGDDGIFLPEADWTHADRLALTSHLSDITRTPSQFRLTYVPTVFSSGESIPGVMRSGMINLAEHAEKSIRSALEGRIPREQLEQLVFMVEYLPDSNGGGTYQLILSSSETGALRSAAARQGLVQQVEEQLREFIRTEVAGGARAGPVEYVSPRRAPEVRLPERGYLQHRGLQIRPLRTAGFVKKIRQNPSRFQLSSEHRSLSS